MEREISWVVAPILLLDFITQHTYNELKKKIRKENYLYPITCFNM